MPAPTVRSLERRDLADVMSLCHAEGYTSFTEDPERTWQALTNPGVTTVVTEREERVVGLAQMLSDGVIQAFLVLVVVSPGPPPGRSGAVPD